MSGADDRAQSDDERWIVVDGRRWRRSDPAIPEALRSELVHELMAARRAVAAASDDEATARARARVQNAKVALGERGEPWWEATDEGTRGRLEAAVLALAAHRDPKTTCPSDAARAVAGTAWRRWMPAAREVAAELADRGLIEMLQRGKTVPAGQRGPIRLRWRHTR